VRTEKGGGVGHFDRGQRRLANEDSWQKGSIGESGDYVGRGLASGNRGTKEKVHPNGGEVQEKNPN